MRSRLTKTRLSRRRPPMSTGQQELGFDRRRFLGRSAAAGAGALVGAAALEALLPSCAAAARSGTTGGDVSRRDGGPIEKITGLQGHAESIDPPNNNGYERTLKWTDISQAVTALTPFAVKGAAHKAGFDTNKPYRFKPFTAHLPSSLGAFHSFLG